MDQARARALLAGERAWLQRLLRAETDQPRPLAYRPRVALRLDGTRALTRVARGRDEVLRARRWPHPGANPREGSYR